MDLIEIFLSLASVFVVLYLLWYFFFTDANLILLLAEKFGRPVSIYRGKVIWVTGASTGLGEAMAYELASVGAKLVLTARSKNLLEEVKDKCIEISQGKLNKDDILVLPFDITNYDVHKTSVNDVLNHFGQIDVLVNNAALYLVGPITHTDREIENKVFDVNFFGAVNLTKLVLKHFLERGQGHIVVISSIAGKFGVPSCASYSATKYALHGYFGSLRMEHHNSNINVTIVCPGIFRSSLYQKTVFTEKPAELSSHYGCNQMTSARCAHLTLVAAANKLFEAWIAYQPFLFMMWAAQYTPDIYTYVMSSVIYTKRRVKELNEGTWPTDLPIWQPFGR